MRQLMRRLRGVRASPRLIIRRQIAWPWRILMLLGAAGIGAIITLLGMSRSGLADGERLSGLAKLEEQLRLETAERKRLEAIANAADSQVKVERTAADRLARQTRELELDNARLKSDLAYLESLLPATDGQGGLAVRGFRVEADPAQSQLGYRALLTQGGRLDRDFVGTLQLFVQLTVQGKATTLTLPDSGAAAAVRDSFKLSFRRAHRVQGVVTLPSGAVVRSVQLRVLEGGSVRAQQTAMP